MIRKGLEGGSYRPLTAEAIDKIHQAAMQVIEEVGFQVNSQTAMSLFEKAGGRIDREKRIVRLPQCKVMELIESAPSEIVLCGQEEKNDIILSGTRVYAGTGGTALYIWDQRKKQKRRKQHLSPENTNRAKPLSSLRAIRFRLVLDSVKN